MRHFFMRISSHPTPSSQITVFNSISMASSRRIRSSRRTAGREATLPGQEVVVAQEAPVRESSNPLGDGQGKPEEADMITLEKVDMYVLLLHLLLQNLTVVYLIEAQGCLWSPARWKFCCLYSQ